MKSETHKPLPDDIIEMLNELPKPKFKHGDGLHPLFKQWKSMIERCSNPQHAGFAAFGGRGITATHEWYDFDNFVLAMGSSYEVAPNKPANMRKNFLARKNLRAGFNQNNCFWTTKAESCQVQAKTVFVDTVFGKGMTFRQLAEYLKLHSGEPMPEGSSDAEVVPYIPWQELRRRYWLNLPLLAPLHWTRKKKKGTAMAIHATAHAKVQSSGSNVTSGSMQLKNDAAIGTARIKIDDDVPLPPSKPKRSDEYREMEVGGVIFIADYTESAARSSIRYYCERGGKGKRLRARNGVDVPTNNTSQIPVDGVYVWRIL